MFPVALGKPADSSLGDRKAGAVLSPICITVDVEPPAPGQRIRSADPDGAPPQFTWGAWVDACDVAGGTAAPTGAGAEKRVTEIRMGSEADEAVDASYEYEDVLTNWEKCTLDVVDGLARQYCPFKKCAREQHKRLVGPGDAEPSTSMEWSNWPDSPSLGGARRNRHSWWEGMRDDVPERYQRWEGIRERNTILSLVFKLCGHGRKLPTLLERVHLFILYASIWWATHIFATRLHGNACRKGWVEACVPLDLGGDCRVGCATASVLDRTPEDYRDYDTVRHATWTKLDVRRAPCLKENVSAACLHPMCAPLDEESCLSRKVQEFYGGFCACAPLFKFYIFQVLVYALMFKVLYMPFWYLFVLDLRRCCGPCMAVVFRCIPVPVYVVMLLFGNRWLWEYVHDEHAFWMEFLYWCLSFVVLCLFEVVKSFLLGFVLGRYVISALCGQCSGAIWKFMLA